MLADQPSEFPYHALIVTLLLLVFASGMLAEGAIQKMRDTAAAEAAKGLKDAKPAVQKAPWYEKSCNEVVWVCRAQERMSKVGGKKT